MHVRVSKDGKYVSKFYGFLFYSIIFSDLCMSTPFERIPMTFIPIHLPFVSLVYSDTQLYFSMNIQNVYNQIITCWQVRNKATQTKTPAIICATLVCRNIGDSSIVAPVVEEAAVLATIVEFRTLAAVMAILLVVVVDIL